MFTYKKQSYGRGKKVVYLLSGWAFDRRFFSPIAFILTLAGYSCVVYSYDASILSPDIHKTIERFNQVKQAIRSQIKQDTENGKIPFALFGTSLGTLIGLMVVNQTPEIKKVILNLTGADIAETIWTWDIVKPWFKKVLQAGGITLDRLKNDWAPLSPINNIHNLDGKDILLYLAERDQVIPFEHGVKFEKALKEKNYNITRVTNFRLKHVSAAAWNLINFPVYLKFLKK